MGLSVDDFIRLWRGGEAGCRTAASTIAKAPAWIEYYIIIMYHNIIIMFADDLMISLQCLLALYYYVIVLYEPLILLLCYIYKRYQNPGKLDNTQPVPLIHLHETLGPHVIS